MQAPPPTAAPLTLGSNAVATALNAAAAATGPIDLSATLTALVEELTAGSELSDTYTEQIPAAVIESLVRLASNLGPKLLEALRDASSTAALSVAVVREARRLSAPTAFSLGQTIGEQAS